MSRASRWAAVIAISGALFLGACNLSHKSETQAPDDNAITSDIQAKLFQDPVLKTRDIKVDAQRGVVVIGGTVASDLEKAAVENIANHEPGVKQVIDQLAVAPQPAPDAAASQPNQEPPSKTAGRRARRATRHPAEAAETAEATAPASAAPAVAAQQAAAEPAPAPVVERPAEAAPPPQPVQVTIPAGTVVTVRMIDSVDSKVNQPGQEFAASLDNPVVARDRVVIPKGADARVRLVNASQSGKFKGRAELALELVQVGTYNVTSGYYTQQGSSRGKRTAESVGGGAALGAIIGAIAGGRKGAAIGAGAGAGVGTGVEAASGRSDVKVPSETKLDFTLKSPLTVIMNPD